MNSRDPDVWSNANICLFKSTRVYFDASRREKHDGVQIISPSYLVQKLFAQNIENVYFDLI